MADENKILIAVQATTAQADRVLADFQARQKQSADQWAMIQRVTAAEVERRRVAAEASAARQVKSIRDQELEQARQRANEEQRLARMTAQERIAAAQAGTTQGSGGGSSPHLRGQGWEFLGGQSFRTVGFQLRAIPGGGIAETLGRLSPLADTLAELATGSSAAGAGVLGLTAGLVAVGVVAGELIRRFNATTEAIREQIKAQTEARRFTLENTREAVEAEVKRVEAQIVRERRLAAEAEAAFLAQQRLVNQRSLGFGSVGLVAGVIGIGENELAELEALRQAREAQATILLNLTTRLLGLNQGLLDSTTATEDARVAEEALKEARLETFQNDVDLALRTQRMTQEQRNERMTEIENEITILQRLGDEHKGNAEIADEVAMRTQVLNAELSYLRSVIITTADVAQIAAVRQDLLNKQTDMLFKTQTQLGEALEGVRIAQEKYDEALRDSETRLAQIAADAEEKRIEAREDANKAIEELDEETQEKRLEQEEEHQDRIAKLIDKAEKDIRTAIGERDALALFLRREKLAEDIAEENEKNAEDLKRIEDAYDDQTEAIQERLDDQLERITRAAQKAADQERRRYADEAVRLQEAINKQKDMVWNAENQLNAIRTGFQNTRVIQEVNWYTTMDQVASVFQNAILFRWQAFWGSMLGGFPTGGGGGDKGKTVKGADFGAYVDGRVYTTIANMADRAGGTRITGVR